MATSARGLFRSTGKTAKVDAPRAAHDFYPTPPEPVRAFLAAERDALLRYPVLWEPAAGDGAMVREMEAAGHATVASDLVDRGMGGAVVSFFDVLEAPTPAIVTNPPYSAINWRDGRGAWIAHAMETLKVEYMALLLSWSWPGAGGHGPMWAKWPPARVYLMRWKVDFTGAGAPPMLNGWFIWDRHAEGETVLRMLDRQEPARSRSKRSVARTRLEGRMTPPSISDTRDCEP